MASASGGCRQARLQSMGSLESDMTERLHFHFSPSCTGEGNGNPLQCSCLENPGYGEAWWAAVSGVAQSWTHLKQLSSSSSREKKAPLAPSLPPAALPVAGPCLLWAAPSCPRLWGQVATSPHRSPVPLGATGMPTCLELPGRAHPASGWRDLSWPSGVQQYSISFLLRPGCLLWSHGAGVWIRSLPQAPVGSPCPRARMVPTDLPDCPPAQTPAQGAGLPTPAPAWARVTHSVCSPAGWGARAGQTWSCLFSERLEVTRGYWGCWLSQVERIPGRLRAHYPPSPVMGAYRPTSGLLRLPERSFSPWTQLCVLRAPPCAGGPERLPELSLEAPRKPALTPVCSAPLPQRPGAARCGLAPRP